MKDFRVYFVLTVFSSAHLGYCVTRNMFEVREQFIGADASKDAFGSDIDEIFPVAYFDVNADKLTDMITVTRNRTNIVIFLANEQPPYFKRTIASEDIAGNLTIISVRPGDFTGNGVTDLMVTLGEDNLKKNEYENNLMTTAVEVVFCVIIGNKLECGDLGMGARIKDLAQEPTVLDLNGDMVLDLLGELCLKVDITIKIDENTTETLAACNRQRTVWLSESNHESFDWSTESFKDRLGGKFQNQTIRNMTRPSSNAFADIDGDSIPELIILTEKVEENQVLKEFYLETFSVGKDTDTKTVFEFKRPPAQIKTDRNQVQILGQPMIIDFQHTGKLSHLVPYCTSKNCDNFGIYVMYQNNQDETVNAFPLPLASLTNAGHHWSFIPPTHHSINSTEPFKMEDFYSRALSLRVGDYNLDGYPDLLGVLQPVGESPEKRVTKAILFENIPCVPAPESPCRYNRTFSANFDIFKDYSNVISVSFYDFGENGALDAILVSMVDFKQASVMQKFRLHAFENQMNFDSSFLKVMVLTGQPCDKEKCTGGIPYGNVLPGATIKYTSLNTHGVEETGAAVQTYRTAHSPLDLPCNIFGIGHSPNFIETLVATAPTQDSDKPNTKVWQQIIPNSQIVVSPSKDGSWTMKLFLTPSDVVLKTFGILVAVCLVLAALAGLLEFKEKREDRKHRQSEAHRLVLWLS